MPSHDQRRAPSRTVFQYLGAPRADDYRAVMVAALAAKDRGKLELSGDELAAAAGVDRRDGDTLLSQLVAWGNLLERHDPTGARSLVEYLARSRRYAVTAAGEAAQRAAERADEAVEDGALSVAALEELRDALRAAADADGERVVARAQRAVNAFEEVAAQAPRFVGRVQRRADDATLREEVDYLERYAQTLPPVIAEMRDAIRRVDDDAEQVHGWRRLRWWVESTEEDEGAEALRGVLLHAVASLSRRLARPAAAGVAARLRGEAAALSDVGDPAGWLADVYDLAEPAHYPTAADPAEDPDRTWQQTAPVAVPDGVARSGRPGSPGRPPKPQRHDRERRRLAERRRSDQRRHHRLAGDLVDTERLSAAPELTGEHREVIAVLLAETFDGVPSAAATPVSLRRGPDGRAVVTLGEHTLDCPDLRVEPRTPEEGW